MAKTKRTYNLSEGTVRAVRELADEYHVASSQDGVVDLAVRELQRRVQDAAETQRWAEAREDRAYRSEADDFAEAYRSADAETWPR